MINKISFLGLLLLGLLLLATPAKANYTLTVTVQGSGTIATNPPRTSYPSGVTVTLTATPNSGWYFANWSGSVSATTNVVNVTMTNNLSVTATFLADPTYTLTVVTNGQGSIVLNPAGGSYSSNTMVTATATPAAGWEFTGWTGATNTTAGAVTLDIDTNLSLTGTFVEPPAFDVQPQSVTNVTGSTVTFTSHSVGTAPVNYQWYFGNNPLPGDTSATLTLPDATGSQAGSYQVVATNLYGSATSVVANLVLTNASQSTNIVSVCDEAGLRAAIAAGGWVSIGCSGTITLSARINITNTVILDGSGVTATISGSNAVQLFYVAAGGSLAISNLTLANGYSSSGSITTPAMGGAIVNNGGTVTLTGCMLTNNLTINNSGGGAAEGGAIYNNGGTVCLYESAILNNTASGGQGVEQGYVPTGPAFGGAIFTTNGSVTILSSLIQSNLCGTGGPGGVLFAGAVFQSSGSLTMTNCILADNQASGGPAGPDSTAAPAYGGALATTGGTVSMNQCQFLANTATGGSGGGDSAAAAAFGGAVYCSNALTAVSCSFSGNSASGGNDSYDFGGASRATAGEGGGIYNVGQVVLRNCLVSSNYSQGGIPIPYAESADNGGNALGGGIFNAGQLAATNSTITRNAVDASQGQKGMFSTASIVYGGNALGGGVYNSAGATFLGVNITIASNLCNALGTGITSIQGHSITNANGLMAGSEIANTNGTVSLLNSLLAYGGTNGNAYGVIIDLGDNISSDGTANFASGSSYNFTDPLLGPLANNGGPTLTMALPADSPAVGFADSDDGAPPDDQRGYARPAGDGVIDLGAYQYGATQVYGAPPTLSLSIVKSYPNVVVSFTTVPAITNTLYLQISTNLINWSNLQTIGAFTSPSNISETISPQSAARQFFRLMW